jgi:hypothetical protein
VIWLKLLGALFVYWPLLLLLFIPRMGVKAGVFFTVVQLLSWWATAIGWVLLIYPCARQLWVVDVDSINTQDPRKVSRWASWWRWLNPVYGQPEDGVSGAEAMIRNAHGSLMPYLPASGPRWRAYSWSALRNSTGGLKYLFEWRDGPLVTFTFLGPRHAGWKEFPQLKGSPHLPVLG